MKKREFVGWVIGAVLLGLVLGYAIAWVSISIYRLIYP